MNNTIDILNRLIDVHSSSLASYMQFASPWVDVGQEEAIASIADVYEDQARTVKRMGELVLDMGGVVQPGVFPMTFTSLHDVSLTYVLQLLVRAQTDDLSIIRKCVESLEPHTVERALAEESQGSAEGHLELFRELSQVAGV